METTDSLQHDTALQTRAAGPLWARNWPEEERRARWHCPFRVPGRCLGDEAKGRG